ncbi:MULTISPECIES: extracellular solute-binding protein [unclassified Beijerinckia]|uniref:molybdate ABC transporter substrate-binding protein n=1 Tax=unclassified Beijerinckia TaxID=2638183 RepID=UPI000895D872|nr:MULTISPECIES: extracellular solute-binding protein [unclassified Beijerinckia]MDH7795458.1 molybdate transport system substrate-binding protein [Beijerinckia sp. GAS462]SEC02417.1 molybdate transport system substrate-binding protein [Beijerinckia sp. 28-YEA-48]
MKSYLFSFALCAVMIPPVASLCSQTAQSAEITVIAANAVKEGYTELVSAFEKSSGHKVVTTWAGTVNATKKVNDGEMYDLVIVGSDNIDQLIKGGKLAAGSRADFAKTGIGVAVRAGLAKPDVSTSEAVKSAVLAAKSVIYSAGPSGAYVGELINKLGIAEQVAPKVKQPSSGAEVAAILSRGEADLGFAQVSEFLNVSGLVALGPLPASIQNYTIYAVGLHTAATSADAAKTLVEHLRAPAAASAIKKMGMEPG